jgi:hypothetical protein
MTVERTNTDFPDLSLRKWARRSWGLGLAWVPPLCNTRAGAVVRGSMTLLTHSNFGRLPRAIFWALRMGSGLVVAVVVQCFADGAEHAVGGADQGVIGRI